MRPPTNYYGGKVRLAPLIASLLPPHATYVEPFANRLLAVQQRLDLLEVGA